MAKAAAEAAAEAGVARHSENFPQLQLDFLSPYAYWLSQQARSAQLALLYQPA